MKIKNVNRLAEILSNVRDGVERSRLVREIGYVCNDEVGSNFDLDRWYESCKRQGHDE